MILEVPIACLIPLCKELHTIMYIFHVAIPACAGDGSHVALADHLGVTLNASPLYSSVSGIHSPLKRSNMEKQYVRTQPKKSERGRHDNILDVNSDSFPSYSLDEEVIGIITMENVIEELLQVRIYNIFSTVIYMKL